MADPLSTLEGIVQSTAGLAYNTFASVLTLFADPVRGAVRLWHRWRQSGTAQLGPSTLLLVASVAATWCVLRENFAQGGVSLILAYATKREFSGILSPARIVVDVLAIYIVTDLLSRLFVALFIGRRLHRTVARNSAITTYLFAFLLLLISLMGIVREDILAYRPSVHSGIRGWLWEHNSLLTAVPMCLLLSYPAANFYGFIFRHNQRRPKPLARKRIFTALFALSLGTIWIYIAADFDYSYLLRRPDLYVERALLPRSEEEFPLPAALSCTLMSDGTLAVRVALWNRSDETRVVDLSSVRLSYGYTWIGLPLSDEMSWQSAYRMNGQILASPDFAKIGPRDVLPLSLTYENKTAVGELYRFTVTNLRTDWSYSYEPGCHITYEILDYENGQVSRSSNDYGFPGFLNVSSQPSTSNVVRQK